MQTLAPRVEEPPVVRLLETVFDRAIALRASDLHFEPKSDGGRIRARVDGLLTDVHAVEFAQYAPLVSRVKLLAGMDIADKRQPQDGRYTLLRGGRSLDARVSSMPTLDGEKLVIRLLDPAARSPRLDSLGMPAGLLERYRRLVSSPFGFVIVTGPTGSGKTTTLYSSLCELSSPARSICTVEDPVELRIEGASQVHVNVRAGLDFPTVLRSCLRQDPNVIMIGEMRDTQTASVGISAALSGQLVLTTLHSSDAPRTIDRLADLGASRQAIASALAAVVSQRLVRKLCAQCRRHEELPADTELRAFGIRTAYAPGGCPACNHTGYHGRIGVFELLEPDDAVREAIGSGGSIAAILDRGKQTGYEPMIVDGIRKAAAGVTALEELRRVVPWS